MIGAAVAALLVALAAAWFIARPLRRPPASAAAEEPREVLVQLRDRLLAQLQELEVESADRNIDPTVAGDERQRLEAELAQVLKRLDAPARTEAGAAAPRALWAAVLVALAVGLPLVAAGLYFTHQGAVLTQLGEIEALAHGEVPPVVRDMVARLEQRLAEQPNDPQGWARLGRAYAVLGRPAEAKRAYAQALALAPGDIEITAAYADFLLSLSPTRPSAQTVALFRKVHAADPTHPGALWALGVAAYQDGQFEQAADYWAQLRAQLPPGHELTGELERAIAATRARAAEQPAEKGAQ